jgi:hypothetical protein
VRWMRAREWAAAVRRSYCGAGSRRRTAALPLLAPSALEGTWRDRRLGASAAAPRRLWTAPTPTPSGCCRYDVAP